jgi:hypothetical protein
VYRNAGWFSGRLGGFLNLVLVLILNRVLAVGMNAGEQKREPKRGEHTKLEHSPVKALR